MPSLTKGDASKTKDYIPKVSSLPTTSPSVAAFYKPIENRNIHEGRIVEESYIKDSFIERYFSNISFGSLYKINEPIIPRFILDFYSQVKLQTDQYGNILISFMIQNHFITLQLSEFAQILQIPYTGQACYANEWDLNSLSRNREKVGPYSSSIASPEEIREVLNLNRGNVERTIHGDPVLISSDKLLLKDLSDDMRKWEEVIRENVISTSGHSDRLIASNAHMIYCLLTETEYNLAYFFVKRIEEVLKFKSANLPYGMFLTRLYHYVMRKYPDLDQSIYESVDRVMLSLTLERTRRPRKDRGKKRASSSSQSSRTPVCLNDDEEAEGIHDYPTNQASSSSSNQASNLILKGQAQLLHEQEMLRLEIRKGFKSVVKGLTKLCKKKK